MTSWALLTVSNATSSSSCRESRWNSSYIRDPPLLSPRSSWPPPQPANHLTSVYTIEGSLVSAMSTNTSSSIAFLQRYDPPKNQLPSRVHRFRLHQSQNPVPTPAPPPAKEEKPALPPAPEWSSWQRIEGPQWEGYWRASFTESCTYYPHVTQQMRFLLTTKPTSWMDVSVH